MSQGPPGAQSRPVLNAPANADETRGDHVRGMIRGSAIWYGIGVGLLAALGAAYLSSNAVILVIGAAIVLVGTVAIVFAIADNRAERDFFRAFAADHGFTYVPGADLPALTPLLSAGDRRHSDHYMEGPLSDQLPGRRCALAHYTFDVEKTDSEGDRSYESHHFTACVVEIEQSLPAFPGVFLVERRGMLSRFDSGNWLRGRGFESASLESSEFEQRYDLLIDPSQDQVKLRELFSPSFVVWCAGHPLHPCFELRAGTLTVFVDGRLEQAGKLHWLIEATREITTRVIDEIGEARGPQAAATSRA